MKNLTTPSSFENFCRICSCQNEKEKLVYIFDNDDLLEKISSCLPVTIHLGDELPHHVCGKCLKAIESSYDLINKAQSSEQFFFNCLKSSGTVKIKTEEGTEDDTSKEQAEPRSLELDGAFSCDLCDSRLPDAEELDAHIQENHVNLKAPPNSEITIHKICSLCGQLFDCAEAYVLHKCESQPDCPHCNKTMPTKCLLNRHITYSCKQLYFCPHCHRTFSGKISFMKHVQAHTGVKSENECLACDRKVHGDGEVTEHTCERGFNDSSSSGKKYRCYICGQAYKRQVNLAKHCLQHQPKTKWNFKCTKCDDVFEKERTLHSHYEKVHKMPKTWVCRYCGKSMSTKLSVQIHERIHTNVKPYVCEWCGNAFRSKANLIQHHAKHTGIRRHKCAVCGKMFSRTFFLKTHLRVHTGERPYQCDICEQRFTQVGDMRRHRKRHEQRHELANSSFCASQSQSQPTVIIVRRGTRTRNFPVVAIDSMPVESVQSVELKIDEEQECKPNLIQHQAMHTGIRKHKCHVCGKMFSRPFFLKTHLRVHTGERPYQCDVCEKRFTQLTDMRRHRKRHDKPTVRAERKSKNEIKREYTEEVHEEIIYVAVDNEELVGQTFEVVTEEEIPMIVQAQDVTYESFPIVETVELKYETVETSYEEN